MYPSNEAGDDGPDKVALIPAGTPYVKAAFARLGELVNDVADAHEDIGGLQWQIAQGGVAMKRREAEVLAKGIKDEADMGRNAESRAAWLTTACMADAVYQADEAAMEGMRRALNLAAHRAAVFEAERSHLSLLIRYEIARLDHAASLGPVIAELR